MKSNGWTKRAIEKYFIFPNKEEYNIDKINCNKVKCSISEIVKGERGVFSRVDLKKGECIEWGIASIIPNYDVRQNDKFFSWDRKDRSVAATLSGCALYYNTLGDKSNARCVPYHNENRFEIYALRDIKKGEELTIRYDSMNYRDGMTDLKKIIGELKEGDR